MDPKDREYTNDEITVSWRPGKCIHATTCYRELIEVFNPRNRPWVNMQGASTEKIIEIVNKCPTEALIWKWNDPEKEKTGADKKTQKKILETNVDEKPVNIQIVKGGPLLVQGKFTVKDENGNELSSLTMTSFCRCGNSKSMPFCDGSHRKIGFEK